MISSRKSLFHPARFNLLRTAVFCLSLIPLTMVRAIRRILAMVSAPFPLPCPLLVLIHGYIQNPMQCVLYSPVSPDPGPKHRHTQGFTPPEIPGLTKGVALDMTLGFHRSNGLPTGLALPFLHPVNIGANTGPACCNTTMILCNNISGPPRSGFPGFPCKPACTGRSVRQRLRSCR